MMHWTNVSFIKGSTNYEPNINSFDVDGLLLKLDKFVPDSRQWPGPVDNTIKLFIH